MKIQHTQRFVLADSTGDEVLSVTENNDGTFDVSANFAEGMSRQELVDLFHRFIEAYEEQGIVVPPKPSPADPNPYAWPGLPNPIYPTGPVISSCDTVPVTAK